MKCNFPGCEKEREPDWSYGPLTCVKHQCPECKGTGLTNGENHDDPRWVPCSECGGKGYIEEFEEKAKELIDS